MSRIDSRVLVAALVVVFTVLQLGLAAVAGVSRRALRDELAAERARLAQLELARDRAAPPTAPAAGGPEQAVRSWQLLQGPDVVRTLQVLQELADDCGVVFDRERAIRASEPGKQPFSVVGHGSPDALCAFLAAIENHERLMVVESGRVQPADDAQVAFEFGVATYHSGGPR